MDKLLELIKEYWVETFNDKKLSKIEYEEKSGTFYWKYQPLPGMKLEQGQILHRTTVLSKDFGFVEWLVENEKIDLDVLKENTVFTMFTHCVGLGCEWHTVSEGDSVLKAIGTDALIAYISIKDKPIEFLVSILK